MHKILLTIFFSAFLVFTSFAQQIEWMSMKEALKSQEKEPRKIFMDAYTTWCGPCKMLDKNTFSNADVANFINKNYYPVKFNAEGNDTIVYQQREFKNPNYDPARRGRNSTHEFTRALKVTGYPSLVFFNEEGGLIGPIPGYRTPHQLEVLLKLFQKEDYKKINDQEAFREYNETFKNEFVVPEK